MNGRIDSGLGQIIIDTDVIATYAGSVAVECFGIVGMAAVSMKDGLVKLLGKNSLKHGISVRITEDNKIRLNFHVIVAYGVNISTIADNLVSNVKYQRTERISGTGWRYRNQYDNDDHGSSSRSRFSGRA